MRVMVWLAPFLATLTCGTFAAQEQPEDLPEVDLPALVAQCESCHGPEGVSGRPDVPSLAGLPADRFIAALEAFYFYERHCPTVEPQGSGASGAPDDMCSIASYLSDEERWALAGFFASRARPVR